MPAAGDKLGPYVLTSPIGEGGMGEVWKARDTRLDRNVAIKFSKSGFNERAEREARAVAALNHPRICTLHDVGPDYLVMEYVDGKPLTGPLPVEAGLRYAIQIAEALDAAHRKGVIHRDLKPANILITRTGVKLLDFGLAKLTGESLANASTTTNALTDKNTIMGTMQYMSPEQLQGNEADARSDIFAFGCVLYEIFSGKRAFDGASAASVITAVMTTNPASLATQEPMSPPALDHLVATCLAKDPEERFQNAHDVLLELRWLAGVSGQSAVPLTPTRSKPRAAWLWPSVAAVFLLAALAIGWTHWREKPPDTPVVRFEIAPPANASFNGVRIYGAAELSPDGSRIVFVANSMLWVRRLDTTEAVSLAGTDSAAYPFWSGDSRYIGFFADGKLKSIAADGGPPQVLCPAPNGRGGTWHGGSDGVIVFAGDNMQGLSLVSASGGEPALVTTLDAARGEETHRVPHFLPDGRHFLYLAGGQPQDKSRVMIGELPKGPARQLFFNESEVRYVPSGYLLYVREGGLLVAQPFDASKLAFKGDATPVAEHVDTGGTRNTAAFSASDTGVLTWRQKGDAATRMVWLDRQGKELAPVPGGDNIPWGEPSPDGKMAVGDRMGPNGLTEIWLVDIARASASKFTFYDVSATDPIWSPDGKRIVYCVERSPAFDVYVRDVNGLNAPQLLLKSPVRVTVDSWSPDNKWILYSESVPGKFAASIWALPLGGGKPVQLIGPTYLNGDSTFSPDGRFWAYASNESGRSEIYVRPFSPDAPEAGGKWQVSIAGGSFPGWRKDGRELFYFAGSKLMAAPVQTGGAFQAGTPVQLFESHGPVWPASDGNRFLAVLPKQAQAEAPQQVTLNWPAALQKRR